MTDFISPDRAVRGSVWRHAVETSDSRPVYVLGAGFSGLVTAFWLRESGIPVKVLEKSQRVGGLLGTHDFAGGKAEQTANGFLWSKGVAALSERLNVPVVPAGEASRARYLVRNGKLRKWPLSIFESLALAGRMLRPRSGVTANLDEFGRHYLGAPATEQLVAPGIGGIYGAPLDRLSPDAVFPNLHHEFSKGPFPVAALRRFAKARRAAEGEALKGQSRGSHAPAQGLQEIIDALADRLSDCIEFGVDAADCDLTNERIVCCLPAYAAREWLQGLDRQELCDALKDVEYLSMTVISAVFNPVDLPGFKPGFGCLIPPSEGFHSLGLLFSHCLFPNRFPADKLFFRSIMRDDDGSLAQKSEVELGTMVAEDAGRLFRASLGLKPEDLTVYRWPNGIPVYSRELTKTWAKLDQLLPQYYPKWRFFGNWTGEISLRGMADAAMTVFGPGS